MAITKKDLFYGIIIILILFLGNFYFVNKINNMSQKFDNYEKTISALGDSIHVTVKNGIAEYAKKSPEIYLDEFIKSEAFKTLAPDQKKYYEELSKIKGLISATSAQLEKQGTDLALIKGLNPGKVEGDTVLYKLGDKLHFAQQDTTKALKWSGELIIDKKPLFNLTYDYKVNVETTFERNKDKSILVNYKINDPELKVNTMLNYTIPAEQKRTKIGRWIDKNKSSFLVTAGTALFLSGGYVEYKLSH